MAAFSPTDSIQLCWPCAGAVSTLILQGQTAVLSIAWSIDSEKEFPAPDHLRKRSHEEVWFGGEQETTTNAHAHAAMAGLFARMGLHCEALVEAAVAIRMPALDSIPASAALAVLLAPPIFRGNLHALRHLLGMEKDELA